MAKPERKRPISAEERIAEIVAEAPPLTDTQRDGLRRIFGSVSPDSTTESPERPS